MDYNRSGVPLIEIVSEPDMRSADEVIAYLETLRQTIQYLGASDCKLNEGSMRADVNLSVREVGSTEVWNPYRDEKPELIQGDRTCHRRRAGASDRAVLKMGRKVVQETRRWDDNKESSSCNAFQRGCTGLSLLPGTGSGTDRYLVRSGSMRSAVVSRNCVPQKLERYRREYDIPEYDAQIITGTKHMADLFEETTKICDKPKKVSNWLMGETMRLLKENSMEAEEICFAPEHLAALIELVDAGTINGSVAKEVFEEMFRSDIDPEKYVEEKGLKVVNDEGALRETIEKVIADNPQSVEDYHNGKKKAMGFLVGQTMKAMKGKANPAMVNAILQELLA